MQNKESMETTSQLHHKLAFFFISTLLLFVLVTLPFTVSSAFQDILGSPYRHTYTIPGGATLPEDQIHGRVNMIISSLDELDRLLTFRIYMRNDFASEVEWKTRMALFAVYAGGMHERLPPSVSVEFPFSEFSTTQTVQLPVHGKPLRYPFDSYEIYLGILFQRVYKDGKVQNVDPEFIRKHVLIQLSEHLPRQKMDAPVDIDPATIGGPSEKTQYIYVEKITLQRPLYLKVISVLLVLLVAAAASYAVFLRPLNELIVNSGALVLGVWGIRTILVAGSSSFVTAVDIALAMVILFLLTAISVRSLEFFKNKCCMSLPWWPHKAEPSDSGASDEIPEEQ